MAKLLAQNFPQVQTAFGFSLFKREIIAHWQQSKEIWRENFFRCRKLTETFPPMALT